MYLKIRIKYLDSNDADYACRQFEEMGAKPHIEFDKYFADVVAVQDGRLEKLLETASFAFHFISYEVTIHT